MALVLRLQAGVFALLLSSLVYASDATEFRSLGFSKDGSYYSFAQTGVSDGSGFSIAEVSVIEVDTNRLVKVIRKESENKTETETLDRAIAEIKLNQYGIQAGRNLGLVLVDRPNNDFSNFTDTVFSLFYWPEGGAAAFVPKYTLNVSEAIDASADPSVCDADSYPAQKLTLTLTGPSSTNIYNRILQADEKLPASRGLCPHAYQVRHVIAFKTKLVVGIKYSRLGFEGPDQRFLAVTAVVPEWK